MTKPMISLCMIVRNEDKNLEGCLQSVLNEVDEIIVVDTGSKDKTKEIARAYTVKVFDYAWNGDFSEVRNFAISKASGEWVLCLDADEILITKEESLREIIKTDEAHAYFLPIFSYSIDNVDLGNKFLVLRLFKNNGRFLFRGKIHEQIIIPEGEKASIIEKVEIWHKHLNEKERNAKRQRNLLLLKKALKKEPKNPYLYYYLGVEWLILGKAEKAVPCLEYAYKNIPVESLIFFGPTIKYLSLSYKFSKRYEEALTICLEGIEKYPDYTDLYFLAGNILEELEEWTIAIKWFEEAVRKGPTPVIFSRLEGADSFLAFYHIGYCYERLKSYEKAIVHYERALELNPQYHFPLFNLTLLKLYLFGPQETFDYFTRRVKITEDTMAALAEMFFRAGYPDWALKLCGNRSIEQTKYSIFNLSPIVSSDTVLTTRHDLYFYRGIGAFLLSDYETFQKTLLELWENKKTRDDAAILFAIKKIDQKEKWHGLRTPSFALTFYSEILKTIPHHKADIAILEKMKKIHLLLKDMIVKSEEKSAVKLLKLYADLIEEQKFIFEVRCPGGIEVSGNDR